MEQAKIIFSPRITEKTIGQAAKGKYTLLVDIKAGKNQIKKALKDIYKVDVIKINVTKICERIKVTPTKFGKMKRRRKAFKKVIVVLKKDQKIPGFEIKK